jgi:hypothetical protein
MSEAFLASVPAQFSTLFLGKQSWGRGERQRLALTDAADSEGYSLGDAEWAPRPYRAAL